MGGRSDRRPQRIRKVRDQGLTSTVTVRVSVDGRIFWSRAKTRYRTGSGG